MCFTVHIGLSDEILKSGGLVSVDVKVSMILFLKPEVFSGVLGQN